MRRVPGLDLARALAIYLMLAAHIGDSDARDADGDGIPFLIHTNGVAPAIFTVLVGMTTAMIARKSDITFARWRVVGRGLVLIALGYALSALHTSIDIVLANLGVMLLLSLVALRWRARTLVIAAVVLTLTGWWITQGLFSAATELGIAYSPVVEKLWSVHYPAVAWMAYIFAGMALTRLKLTSTKAQGLAVATGLALMVAAAAIGYAFRSSNVAPNGAREVTWASLGAHTNSPVEMTLNIGFAVAAIAASLWLAPKLERWLWPVLALGTMSLTAYTVQILAIWASGSGLVNDPHNAYLVIGCVLLTALAAVWSKTIGAGPLERVTTWFSTWLATRLTARGST